jgi:hypothetical protein
MGIFDFITGIISPVKSIIDNLHASETEKLALSGKVFEAQVGFSMKLLEYENQLLEAQKSVIVAEASGTSWLQKSWRPISMLVFVALIVARWMGLSAPNLSEAEYLKLWQIVEIGLGGYVAGRSLEKIVPPVVEALKKK